MTEEKTLLHEENPISLRGAWVLDDGYVVSFSLTPRWLTTAVPGPRNYGKSDRTYLYRRQRSFFARKALVPLGNTQKKLFSWSSPSGKNRGFWGWVGYLGYRRLVISLEKDIKVMAFIDPPEMRLLWSDSGHSVALYLEGQPWAFMHEEKNHGYSKGVLRPGVGNTWDQELFEQTFINK
jgi:hypothetical protein